MGQTVSAIPSKLTGWASWAGDLDRTLASRAKSLDSALAALNSSKADPSVFTPVAYIGEDIAGYAARNHTIDSWVGGVGRAIFEAGTKGIPPQVMGAGYNQYWSTRYTTDEKSVDAQAGRNPIEKADAREKAAELREAVDRHDAARVRAIADSLKSHDDDQEYMVAFFSSLGPKYTVRAVKFMDDEHDPEQEAALRSWDRGLALATRSPSWDPAFNSAIFPKPRDWGDPPSHDAVLLLKYGEGDHMYSQDMLEKAGDAVFFRGPHGTTASEHDMAIVLRALSHNPNAAADWFNGRPPVSMSSDGHRGHTRLQDLIVSNRLHGRGWSGDLASAMDAAIGAAARGSDPESFLRNLAAVPDEYLDGLRGGLARAISNCIPLMVRLLQSKDDKRWATHLVREAIAGQDGHVNAANEKRIVDAMARYGAGALDGLANASDSSSNMSAVYEAQDKLNALLKTMLKELDDAAADKAAREELDEQFMDTMLDLIPGGKAGVELAKSVGLAVLSYIRGNQSQQQNESSAERKKELVEATVLGTLTVRFVAEHPGAVPKGMSPTEYATKLATAYYDYDESILPDDPKERRMVQHFIGDMRGIHFDDLGR